MALFEFAPLLCALLFAGILVLFEIGRRIGRSRVAADPEGAHKGIGAVEGSVFGLVGLLIAFTFSGAAARFEGRRQLVVEEANSIGTAWLRLDLLPADDQPPARELFRQYLDARLATYSKLPDLPASELEHKRSTRIQEQIWQHAIHAVHSSPPPVTTVLMPALNSMFDIAATRVMASRTHPPMTIYGMLLVLMLAGATLIGYAMAGGRSRNWLHILGFALITTLTLYVIIDLEFPRFGFIRVDAADQMLRELRESMR
jgi:hypothetical protein